MKATTLQKRMSEVKANKNSMAYRMIMLAMNSNGFIRPVSVQGSGRFIKNADYTSDVITLLKKLNIKFESGNDAPRGGACGNFIQINKRQLVK